MELLESVCSEQIVSRIDVEIVMPPAKKAAPAAKKTAATAKAAPQATVRFKHLAASLADSHDLPRKQVEAVLGDLVTRHQASCSACPAQLIALFDLMRMLQRHTGREQT